MSENVGSTPTLPEVIEENGKPKESTEEKPKNDLEELTVDPKIEHIENDNGAHFEEDDLPLDLILKEENEQQALNDAMGAKAPEDVIGMSSNFICAWVFDASS